MKKNNTNASDKQPETGKTEYIIKKGFRRASEVDLTQSGSTGGFRKSRQSECNKLAQSAKSGV